MNIPIVNILIDDSVMYLLCLLMDHIESQIRTNFFFIITQKENIVDDHSLSKEEENITIRTSFRLLADQNNFL